MGLKNIPDDLIFENILTKLPVKSILRFMAVEKAWYSHIKSHRFIVNHSQSGSEARDERLFLLQHGKKYHPCIILDRDTLVEIKRFDFDTDDLINYRYNQFCNGLLLVMNEFSGHPPEESCDDDGYCCARLTEEHILWNPTIRKFKKIESRTRSMSMPFHERVKRGLGFNDLNKDHVIVRITYEYNNDVNYCRAYQLINMAPSTSRVDVYSLSSDSWHRIDSNPGGLNVFGKPLYVNGSVHWVANSPEDDSCWKLSILLFDVRDECFRELNLPLGICVHAELNEFQGSMACLGHDTGGYYNLWVMTEYGVSDSWTKKFVFHHRSIVVVAKNELWVSKSSQGYEQGVRKVEIIQDLEESTLYDFKETLFLL